MLRRTVATTLLSNQLCARTGATTSFVPSHLMSMRFYAIAIKVPFIAESINSGKIIDWKKTPGDAVEEDEVICQVESDKLAADVRAPKDGKITKIMAPDGENVTVGQEIAEMEEGAVEKKAEASSEEKKPEAAAKTESAPAKAAPAAAAPAKAAAATPQAQQVVVSGSDPRARHVRTSAMRQRIADRLKASQNTAAMLTTFNEINMTPLIQLRNKYKDEFAKKHGVKLGFMSPFAKAAACALKEVPIVNASYNTETIEYHDYVDISIAVATPTGLVVPVLRDVQDMNLADIEKKIEDYGQRAKVGKITLPEMTGGTFTISNGGTFGSWMGTPIINPPQSAILGMHATKKKAWVDEKSGEVVPRDIMAVALTYDHRLIDGRDAVTFLVKIKQYIEDPVRIVLDL